MNECGARGRHEAGCHGHLPCAANRSAGMTPTPLSHYHPFSANHSRRRAPRDHSWQLAASITARDQGMQWADLIS